MMKNIGKLVLMSAMTISLFSLTSCNNNKITPPENLKVNKVDELLTWTKVKEAIGYIVNTGQEQHRVKKPQFNLKNLTEGEYTFSVRSIAEDNKSLSNWSEAITYTVDARPDINLRLINGGSEYAVTSFGKAKGEVVIPDTYRNKPITEISEKAFDSYYDIKSVKLGSNIKYIKKNAFKNSGIEKVEFNDKLLEIESNAFQGCRYLKTINMPNSVVSIGDLAFSKCIELTSVKLSDNLKTLNKGVFSDCEKLENVAIPESLKVIGEGAFSGDEKLKNITLNSNLETLGNFAFFDCKSLKNITVPSKVEEIGDSCFKNCESLVKVTLNNGLKVIGEEAFSDNKNLNDVSIPETVIKVKQNAFANTKLYNNSKDVFYIDSWLIKATNEDINEINIQDGTKGIANKAIAELHSLSKVFFPSSLKFIGDYNFYKTNELYEATLNEGLEEIGKYVFYECPGLYLNTIPNSVSKIGKKSMNKTINWDEDNSQIIIGNWLFNKAVDVHNLVIPSNIVGIPDYAFSNQSVLETIEFNENLKYIGDAAFYQNKSLIEVNLPDSVETIGDFAFSRCKNITDIKLPPKLKRVNKSAFYKNYKLTNVTFNEGLEEIDEFAFYQCGLVDVKLPNSLKTINDCAFYKNIYLSNISLNEGIEEISPYSFYICSSLKKLSIPSSVKEIGDKAFYGCNELSDLEIKEGVISIGEYAFYNNSNLDNVVLPNSLKRIERYAFMRCESLSNLKLSNSIEFIGKYAFLGCKNLKHLYLPKSLKTIEPYAFASNNNIVFYTDGSLEAMDWPKTWNSSYRPVFYECDLDENGYIKSFVISPKTTLNLSAINISLPNKEGYTIKGFTSIKDSQDALFKIEELQDLDEGTKIYVIYERNA